MTDVLGFLLQVGPHVPYGPHGPHGPTGPNGAGGWGVMPWSAGGAGLLPALLWLLVLLAVVAGLAYLARWLAEGRSPAGTDTSAGANAAGVLERRYGRGENDEEFERRRDRLAAGA